MFKFSVYGQRVGRIAFGAVLVLGAVVLVRRVATTDDAGGAYLIPAVWAAAFAAYVIAGRIGSRRTLDNPDELASPGLVVPSVGVALLMPLTLHLPFALLIAREARAFDMWAMLSMIITGPTHLVLAALTAHRARQLATGRIPLSPMKIYGACVAVSCLPFAIFVLPPVFVMLTGLALYPLIAWM